jgi:hypothetical protein
MGFTWFDANDSGLVVHVNTPTRPVSILLCINRHYKLRSVLLGGSYDLWREGTTETGDAFIRRDLANLVPRPEPGRGDSRSRAVAAGANNGSKGGEYFDPG